MADGKVVIDTRIDVTGAKADMENVKKTVKKEAENVTKASKISLDIDTSKIQAILDDTEKSAKSKAASIAAIYRKAGYDSSEAFSLAWTNIERGTASLEDASSKTKKWKSHVDNTKHSFDSINNALKSIVKKLAVVFSVRKLINIGTEAVELASDIEEVQNVVDTAFGDMAYKMEKFADTAIETYGISKLTAKRTGSTYMAMAKGLGLSMEEASNMSITLTGLTADMASFYNVSQEVADTAIKSVFTGETESLKRYGIVMTEVNLQEFAYKQGITKKISAMTQAEKVQLRYNYVMSQTTLAQGDFAKTSDSWANQTRILSERWKEFLSVVGTGLIQILTPALRVSNDFLSTMISLANAIAKAFGGNSLSVTKQQNDNISGITDATNDATDATKDLAKAQQGLSPLDELNVVQRDTTTSSGGADTSVASGIGGIVQVTKEVPEANDGLSKLQSILEPLSKISLTNLNTALGTLKDALGKFGDRVGEGLKWLYDNVLVPFATWTIQEAIPSFLKLLSSALGLIVAVWDSAKPALQWLWESFLKPLASFTGDVIVNLFDDIASFLDTVIKNQTAVDVLAGIGLGLATIKGASVVTSSMSAFSTWLKGLSTLGQIGVGIGVALVGFEIGKTLYEKVPSVQEVTDALVALFGDLFTGKTKLGDLTADIKLMVTDTVATVKSKISAVTSKIGSFTYNLVSKIAEKSDAIKSKVKGVVDKLGNFAYNIVSKITEKADNVKTKINTSIKNIGNFTYNMVSKISEKADTIKTKINGVVGKIGNFAFNLYGAVKSTANGLKDTINGILLKVGSFAVNISLAIGTKWESFKSTLKSWVGNIITWLNNNLIDKLNSFFTVTIPKNDVTKFLGVSGTHSIISLPKIPALATGAVLPANNPFLAMVGDQKHGTNIEAPLDTIVEAFKIANRENQQRVVFEVVGDPHGMFRVMQKQAEDYLDSTGRQPF